jgi:hypothetical protein
VLGRHPRGRKRRGLVARDQPRKVVGMLTRSDLLSAHKPRLEELDLAERHLGFPRGQGVTGVPSDEAGRQGRARARNIV